ncbi:MAG: hypothetical protein DRQ56_10555 [Gammaproteobacteria bacterium]|nr:MAG: hypothetical protein DRQ56_10555 [Gammaproteobacteria bacterium]
MTGIDYEAAAAAVNEIFETNALTNVGFSEKDVVDAVLNAALADMGTLYRICDECEGQGGTIVFCDKCVNSDVWGMVEICPKGTE